MTNKASERPHSVVVKLNDAELAWLEACAGYLSRRGQPTSLEGMLRIAVAEWSPPIDVSLSVRRAPSVKHRADLAAHKLCVCGACSK